MKEGETFRLGGASGLVVRRLCMSFAHYTGCSLVRSVAAYNPFCSLTMDLEGQECAYS